MPLIPVLGKLAVKYIVPLIIQKIAELSIKGTVQGWKKIRKKRVPNVPHGS